MNKENLDWLIDDIIHDLETLDFNSPEARKVVKDVLKKVDKNAREELIEEIEKEANILEDKIRSSGGSKKEIEEAFDYFHFVFEEINYKKEQI